jgi:hypothetical protein
MNRKVLIIFTFHFSLFSFLFSPSLYAFGKKDNIEQDRINNKWILCITAFDYTMLPQSRYAAGEVFTRNLVDKLKSISYRIRLSPEYAYYESYAWQQSLNTTAKAISLKQDERSQLLYRGETERRYQRNLERIDGDIAKLLIQLAEKEAEKPLVNTEPVFELSASNISGSYPEAPKPGTERRFCRTQNIDAFLSGEMRELHGRLYLKLFLYVLYANSFVYEDNIIFSMEDTDIAVDEIAARLTAVLAGTKPAVVAVRANPPESQVLINQNYAGRGIVDERERPPGHIIVSVAADGFAPESVEVDLAGGEFTDININLGPLLYANVNVSVPGKTDVSVYHGSLYVGEAPLTLRLPINQLEYISVETGRGETARAILATPDIFDGSVFYSLKTKMPQPQGEKRLNKARSRYYWAWAGTWTALLATWISSGMYGNQTTMESAMRMYYINSGARIALAVSGAYTIFQIGRYIYTANQSSTPLVKQEKQ